MLMLVTSEHHVICQAEISTGIIKIIHMFASEEKGDGRTGEPTAAAHIMPTEAAAAAAHIMPRCYCAGPAVAAEAVAAAAETTTHSFSVSAQ
jgi:hypothetical protein